MDPMESMSAAGGIPPKDFNAEDAGNMEDVRQYHYRNHQSSLSGSRLCGI